MMPSAERELESRVHEIMSEAIPDIRIKLAEMSGKQDAAFAKLESVESVMLRHVEVSSDTNQLVHAHAVRLASLETSHAESAKTRDRWRTWAMGVAASVVGAVILGFLKAKGIF
jgi:hypothetical protein